MLLLLCIKYIYTFSNKCLLLMIEYVLCFLLYFDVAFNICRICKTLFESFWRMLYTVSINYYCNYFYVYLLTGDAIYVYYTLYVCMYIKFLFKLLNKFSGRL